jgi:ABC-type uncharacterized transport system fused permease/ATPase subunit
LNENQTTVVIHVNDVNDLPPVFNSTLYTGLLEEEFVGPHPYRLLQVQWLLLVVVVVVGFAIILKTWSGNLYFGFLQHYVKRLKADLLSALLYCHVVYFSVNHLVQCF